MTLIVILHVFLCLFLIAVILLQAGKGDAGIGFGSSSQSIFGSKTAGNMLTKTTTVVASLFLLTSFVLTKAKINETKGIKIDIQDPAKKSPVQIPAAAPTTPPKDTATTEKKN